MPLGNIHKRISSVDHWLDSPSFEQGQYLERKTLTDRNFFFKRPRAQNGSRQFGALTHHRSQIEWNVATSHHSHLHNVTLERKTRDVAVHIVATDHVKHSVYATTTSRRLHSIYKIFSLVVNNYVSTKCLTCIHLVC